MDFFNITKSNIDALYDFNRQLAVDEGQKELFTANRRDYSEAFLSEHPFSFGFLCLQDGRVVGFYIYFFKFSSYLGSRVFYIEDIYLKHKYRTRENKLYLLQHALEQSIKQDCCRVEMRVLKTFNFGYEVIKEIGFNRIDKWDVFRFEHISIK